MTPITLPHATLGRTGVIVSKLGFGSMQLHRAQLDPADTDRLLNAVLDVGINVIDTSPDYGAAEGHIGRAISHRRDEYFLASKCGCPVGVEVTGRTPHVYSRENVRGGVEQSLSRLRTDHLDLVQFHVSPSPETLAEDDSVAELLALRDEGKVRFLGMSGTLPHLPDQIAMGVFDVFQMPYSAVQREYEDLVTAAARSGAGTIVRGGMGGGLPKTRDVPEPHKSEIEDRRRRFDRADLSDLLDGMSVMDLMLRFTISHPDLHTTIVGTGKYEHLAANLAAAEQGPLPTDVYEEMKRRFT